MTAPPSIEVRGASRGAVRFAVATFAVTALVLLLGWAALAPVSLWWMHIATQSFGTPMAVLLAALLAATCGRLLQNVAARRAGLPPPPLFDRSDLPFAILLIVLLASAIGRERADVSWRLGSQLVLTLGGTWLVGKLVARTLRPLPLGAVVCTFGLAVAVYGIVEVVTGANAIHELLRGNPYYPHYQALGRPIATQANPAPLGTFLLVTGFVSGGALLLPGWRALTLRQLLAVLAVAPQGTCLLMTGSRGAFVGLCVGLCALLRRRTLAFGIAAGTAVVAVMSWLPPPYDQLGFFRVFGAGGFLAQDRSIRQHAAIGMWRDHPLLGVGFDHYQVHFAGHVGTDPVLAQLAYTPDSAWLTLLAENGALGVVAFAWFAVTLVRRGLLRTDPGIEEHAGSARLRRAATAGLIGVLVNFAGYSGLYWTSPCMLFGLLCGIVSGLGQGPRR